MKSFKQTTNTSEVDMAESHDQLDEATRFATAMKSAIAAHERGDHKRAKYHLDNAKTARLSLKSTEYGKHKELLDKYKEMSALHEELTDKTIKASDRVKVARMIADMLGVENAESLSPDAAVNQGLRKIKSKRMTPEFVATVKKMVQLAGEVGIKVDMTLLPKAVSEAKDESVVVDKDSTYNAAKGILRYKDFAKLSKINNGIIPVSDKPARSPTVFEQEDAETASDKDKEDTIQNIPTQIGSSMQHPSDDHLRRRKVAYKTEDIASADYKINPETGRKYRAHKIEFASSGAKGKLDHDDSEDQVKEQSIDYDTGKHKDKMDQQVKKAGLILRHTKERQAMADRHHNQKEGVTEEVDDEFDLPEDELDKMANAIENEDHILDEYEDDELVIIDQDTGEVVDDLKEEVVALQEVLSRSERLKAKIRFARTSSKRARRLQVALRTRSSTPKINTRARRLAVKLMKQRIARKPVGQMTVSEKERAERIIQRRKEVINRLAMKLAPRIRRIENDRLSGHKGASPKVGM